jgi:RNA polymerase sigma factor (sigma-70 family)
MTKFEDQPTGYIEAPLPSELDFSGLITAIEVGTPMLLSGAIRALGNREDAEDALQETFLKAFRGWGNFRNGSKPTTWLFGILRNVIKDRKRAVGCRIQEAPLDELPEIASSKSAIDPVVSLLRTEAHDEMLGHFRELPSAHQLVLALYAYGQYKPSEIATHLGRSTGGVKVDISRAKGRVRELMLSQGSSSVSDQD